MPAKRKGLTWELQEADGTVALRGGENHVLRAHPRMEITTSDGGKLRISLREASPGVVYMDVRDEVGSTRGAIEIQPREGKFDLHLFGDHGTSPNRVNVPARPRGKRS